MPTSKIDQAPHRLSGYLGVVLGAMLASLALGACAVDRGETTAAGQTEAVEGAACPSANILPPSSAADAKCLPVGAVCRQGKGRICCSGACTCLTFGCECVPSGG